MTPAEKMQRLFNAFTERYGTYSLKDGQSLAAIQRSWERSLGDYRMEDLVRVCQDWCDNASKPFWPEPSQIYDALKARLIAPERIDTDKRAEHIKQAEQDFAVWMRGMLQGFPVIVDEMLVTRSDAEQALMWMIAKPGRHTLLFLGTQAWLSGIVPNRFDELLKDWVARAKRGRETYDACKRQHGLARANMMQP